MATILIVEHNDANMRFASFLVESVGHTVMAATDAETGVALARSRKPDLILMDVHLPGMDGLEATALLKLDPETRSIPIIALTALTSPGDEDRIRAAGCDGCVVKPLRYQSLLASVAAQLAPDTSRMPTVERSPRVLVVDDDPQALAALSVMLSPHGFEVRTAGNGEDALAIIAAEPPDLVLLDVLMPGIDGYEVAQRLKASPKTANIPVIMVTALHDGAARVLGLTVGAEDFVAKPVQSGELVVRIRNLLRLKTYGDYRDKQSQLLEGEVGARTADLIESERLYRATFEAAPVGVVHLGYGGRLLRVNERLSQILGYEKDELQRMNLRDLMLPEAIDAQVLAFARLVDGTLDRHLDEDVRYRKADGTFVSARANIAAHRDAAGRVQYFIALIEDTTERRMLEAQLRQAGKLDAIGQLAAGVAHDFNNLLSIVLSYSELLMLDLQEGDPVRADVSEIKEAGLRAVELTRQLLAFSRKQVLQPQVLDLAEVVQGMERMVRRLMGEDVDVRIAAELDHAKVLVDRGQIEQVLMNLAVNARDAMPRGGKLTIETRSVVLDESYVADHLGVTAGPHVMLAVSDTGTGMDEATQARMFEPFFTTKDVGKGTGLGLATVFGVVRQSGGTIWVYSEVGIGTTFKLYFPVTGRAESVAPPPVPIDAASLRGHETVLLVEDEGRLRAVAHTILRRYGYEVIEAQGAGDALLFSEQHAGTIDLLLTDVVMPHMGGRALAERLALTRPTMKVLYMSGYTDDAVVQHGILDASIAFIQKPITPEALARKIRQVLGEPP